MVGFDKRHFRRFAVGLALAGWFAFPPPGRCGALTFSKPKPLAFLPWNGTSTAGIDGMAVDPGGRIYLEKGLDFSLYSPQGKFLRSFQVTVLAGKFFGFSGMEALPDGKLLLLARLESPLEEANKDNFEERSQPGARLLTLDDKGTVLSDQSYLDKDQPHSNYILDRGRVVSLREDGSLKNLGPGGAVPDPALQEFARLTRTPAAWLEHVRSLSVYHTGDRSYHDINGGLHTIRGAVSFLMGRRFVEGLGPLGMRRGRIYYQVLCDKGKDFIPSVFVEDPKLMFYGLVELIPVGEDLKEAPNPVVEVDSRGNILEGVATREGCKVYRWEAPVQ